MAILRCSQCRRRTSDAGGTCEHCGCEIDDTFDWIAGRRSFEATRHTTTREEAVEPSGAADTTLSAVPGNAAERVALSAVGGTTRRRRTLLGGVLLLGALILGLGAWSTYTSPFITFGTERVALSDAAMRDLEELSRQMGRAGAGAALDQLAGGIAERIRDRRRTVKLAVSGALACALLGVMALRHRPQSGAR